jgi:anti-sigma factor RsiW
MTTEPRREELVDLALGLLEPAEARALEAHAEGCAACRAELAALRQTRRLVGGLPPLPAPERGAAVLLAAARQATEARRPRWALPRWLAGGALGLAGATALALLVLRGPVAPTRGPLSEDRESLLGRAAPAAVLPAAPAAAPEAPAVIAAEVAAVEVKAAEEAKAAPVTPAAPRRAAPSEKRAAATEEGRVATRDEAGEAFRARADEQAAPARKAEAAIGGAAADRMAAPGPATGAPASPADLPSSPAPVVTAAPPALNGFAASGEAQSTNRARSAASAGEAAPLKQAAAPCQLEQRRRLLRDPWGRVTGRQREGRYPAERGDVPLRIEEQYAVDGRLLSANVRIGERLLVLLPADLAAGRLEPLPGVAWAATAEEAERTPPRCDP